MVEALGDQNPIYVDDEAAKAAGHGGIVAPPTMMQTWSMAGLRGNRRGGDAKATGRDAILNQLDDAGFTSVVATNCEQEYFRYLQPGDRVTVTSTVESVSEEKATGLGVGHFVTTRDEYRDQNGELVGTHMFRILKFKPGTGKSGPPPEKDRPKRPRVSVTRDNAFWFDALKEGKLLIQRCASCGTLRHPPGPMCSECRSLEWDTVEASGRGTVYSFTVNHYPQVPAFDYPLVVVLVELEEGTRVISNLLDVAPEDVEIGMPVQVEFVQFDEELTLPQFRKVG
jgi:uncharacterized protein